MPFAGRCVVLPASVRSIGEAAFAECNSLVAIAVDPANAFYRTVDGVLFDKNQETLLYRLRSE